VSKHRAKHPSCRCFTHSHLSALEGQNQDSCLLETHLPDFLHLLPALLGLLPGLPGSTYCPPEITRRRPNALFRVSWSTIQEHLLNPSGRLFRNCLLDVGVFCHDVSTDC